MSSSSTGAEETPASPTEQQANAPEAITMDAKLMVAKASGDVQQLKDLVKKQEDSNMIVVVMAKQAAPMEKHHPGPGDMDMDSHLLALVSSGSSEKLKALFNGKDGQAPGSGGTTNGSLSNGDDTEANESILNGITAEGDTALHVVAANGYCNGDNFLESARTIYGKAKHLLFMQNNNGDTPLHCAAQAGKSNMVKCLINLALGESEGRVKELLRKENKHKEPALHEAVRVGNKDIVDLVMQEDSELASFPQHNGASSPMYLAIVLKRDEIVKILYEKSHGKLSFSGSNGQNALHAAVLRHRDLTMSLLEWNKTHLCPQNKDLTIQRDENGSTPLHFVAAIDFPFQFCPPGTWRQVLSEANPDATAIKFILRFWRSSICHQVLEANADALYQPDHAGFFPIHVAASVGASWNVDMFIKRYPGSAGLRNAKGRTFLHVAVEKQKANIIRNACRNLSLSWIMNMVDKDGNTALHLAVMAGSLRLFCPLLANPQVNLNLPNSRGETPLDIAEYKFPKDGLYYNQNSEVQIRRTLRIAGAVEGARRQDHLLEVNRTVSVKEHDETKKMEALKNLTQTLCIGSVLITTVTFGATFALPGGYIADDHNHGGSPVLARRYAFDAFIMANTLAFVFSGMATTGLMYSGSPLLNTRRRQIHLSTAVYLLSISITSLAAAFALGAYVVLAPVSHKTAVATCVLTSIVLLYKKLEFIWVRSLLLPPLWTRKGPIWALGYSANLIVQSMVWEYWPLIFIFGWATHAKPALIHK